MCATDIINVCFRVMMRTPGVGGGEVIPYDGSTHQECACGGIILKIFCDLIQTDFL